MTYQKLKHKYLFDFQSMTEEELESLLEFESAPEDISKIQRKLRNIRFTRKLQQREQEQKEKYKQIYLKWLDQGVMSKRDHMNDLVFFYRDEEIFRIKSNENYWDVVDEMLEVSID